MKVFDIVPIGKPRMTRRDRWKKRPCVLGYFAFRDQVRAAGITLPNSGYHVTCIMPMPPSWSRKKRERLRGQMHEQKPDKDNLEKALLDAVFKDDAKVWNGMISKIWGEKGRIIVDCVPFDVDQYRESLEDFTK